MKFSPDDPKLTAYVLGELNQAEAAAIEQELKNSPALRQAFEEIRATAEFLKTEFAAEGKLSLSEQQKQTIAAKLPPTNVIPMPKRKIAVFVSTSAIAASVMAILAWGLWVTPKGAKLVTSHSEYKYAQNAQGAEKRKVQEETGKNTKQPVPQHGIPFVSRTNFTATVNQQLKDYFAAAGVDLQSPKYLFYNDRLGQVLVRATESDIQTISTALEVLDCLVITNSQTNTIAQNTQALQTRTFQVDPAKLVAGVESVISLSFADTSKNGQSAAFSIPRVTLALNSTGRGGSATLNGGPQIQAQKSLLPQITGDRIPTDKSAHWNPATANANPALALRGTPPSSGNIDLAKGSVQQVTVNKSASAKRKDYASAKMEQPAAASTPAVPLQLLAGASGVAAYPGDKWSIGTSTGEDIDNYEVGINRGTDRPDGRKFFRTRAPDRSGTARYPQYVENAFESVLNAPLSTVSIDVDTASYANVRRFLNQNQLPPRDAVRIEELINYFSYDYPQPHGSDPFSVNMEVAGCPWNKAHRLVRVGLKGKEMAQDKRPPSNFVFLVDVSGSMSPSERLPLIKQALRMLVKKMTENDRIAMVVYASTSGVVLESTSCMNKEKILEAIDRLEAGGSTNGGQGIQKAYALAEENFIKGGVNRVILATDGDFNVGITDQNELINLIQKKAKTGVFLSALGVGTDNYKDALLQKLADKGNGNYHYLDTLEEAQKVLIQQMNGTLVTIAKDVKIQIEFNPAQVQSYRLIGYEKRIMEAQDFNNDKKDAGEIGAGHTVTALYEIIPTGVDEDEPRPAVDDLKYQSKPARKTPKAEVREPRSDDSGELLTLKMRYKKPDGDTSKLIEFPLRESGKKFSNASTDFRFAAAVAGFGMLLKDSEYRGNIGYEQVRELAEGAKGDDKEGYRSEFINLVKKAKSLDRNRE